MTVTFCSLSIFESGCIFIIQCLLSLDIIIKIFSDNELC